MPDTPTFVVNDRRKFTSEGELRHDSPPAPASGAAPSTASAPHEPHGASDTSSGPQLVAAGASTELADLPESSAFAATGETEAVREPRGPLESSEEPETFADDGSLPPGPTDEQSAEVTRAYDATVDRLDTAMRAADPGGERMPEMSFERLTQSLYTQALLLLGGGAQPGETPRVDILGARQTIDMIAIIAARTKGNLSANEDKLLQSALFDLRMGFLEITQALARQAAQRQNPGGLGGPGGPGGLSGPGSLGGMSPGAGPRIVR